MPHHHTTSPEPRRLLTARSALEGALASEQRHEQSGRQLREQTTRARAEVASMIRKEAVGRMGNVRALAVAVAAEMELSPSTVRSALYEYPYRADVLSKCLDVLAATERPAPPPVRRALAA